MDALTDACMVTETGVWVLTQRQLVQVSAYLVLLCTHQAASTGVEMGSRGSRRRGPSSLGVRGGLDSANPRDFAPTFEPSARGGKLSV